MKKGLQDIEKMPEAWLVKKKFGKDVSNEDVDQFYENLMKMWLWSKVNRSWWRWFFSVSASEPVRKKIKEYYGGEGSRRKFSEKVSNILNFNGSSFKKAVTLTTINI